ncbi:MAG: glycosyltransferase family 2 protein [Myxococcota bacterium]
MGSLAPMRYGPRMLMGFLGSVGAAATLPGTTELLLLTAGGMLPPRRPGPATRPLRRLAVVVPAHNEEAGIASCVESLRACEHPDAAVEILVVADNCSDETAANAREAGATVLEREDAERRGKGYALELAFERLFFAYPDLDAVLVVDADTIVAPNFLRAMEAWFAQGSDAVQCRYTVRNADASTRTRLMNVALMAFNVLRPRGRARWGLSAGILGNGFGLSRSALEAVPYAARSVVEDLEHHLDLVRTGMRVDFVDETWVKADFPAGERGADTQRARWEGGRLRMMIDHVPGLVASVLQGEWRLFEPVLDLTLLPLAMHVGALGLVLVIPFPPTQVIAALGLATVAAHVGAALWVGKAGAGELRALLTAPLYVAWKAGLLRKIVEAAAPDQEWVRTARETA